jgi:hypothetical protein
MNGENAAYYARQGTRTADIWTLLHPPYTAWNMSYVVLGAALAPSIDWQVLGLMLLAFFCGTGIAAHALDEFNGRPLKTGFSDRELKLLAAAGLICSTALGMMLIRYTSPLILLIVGAGIFLVLAYNLEWWQGMFHGDLGFALVWGAFPVLAGYWTQSGTISAAALAGAAAATLLSLVQRSLSTPARFWEKPLRLLSWSIKPAGRKNLKIVRDRRIRNMAAVSGDLLFGGARNAATNLS